MLSTNLVHGTVQTILTAALGYAAAQGHHGGVRRGSEGAIEACSMLDGRGALLSRAFLPAVLL